MVSYMVSENSIDERAIGRSFPQIIDLPVGYDEEADNSLYKREINILPDKEINLSNLPLSLSANLTDIVSTAYLSDGLLINQKVKDIFSRFQLPKEKKYYPATIKLGNDFYQYYMFLFKVDVTSAIDFQKSTFYIGFDLNNVNEKLQFESSKDYSKKYDEYIKQYKLIKPYCLHFKNDPSLDLFRETPSSTNLFLSRKLIEELEINNVVGLEYRESSRVFFNTKLPNWE